MANSNPNDITAYRKKRKLKSGILKLLVVLLIASGILIIWLNADTIFEPLRGIASKIETTTSDEEGFPVSLPGSATYSFNNFGSGFLLLTDTYLYTYYQSGKQAYALQHGYTNAIERSNEKRILLYDKNSFEFSLYNKTSQIYSVTLEDNIVYGALSDNDYTAIVTSSTRYSNVLQVYDGNGNWKFTKKFLEENVMQVDFLDENNIIVTTLGSKDGDIITTVYRYNITSGDSEVWKALITGGSVSFNVDAEAGAVKILCDNGFFVFDAEQGSLLGKYDFNGFVEDFSLTNKYNAILYTDNASNKKTIVTIGNDGAVISSALVLSTVNNIEISNDMVYTLEDGRLSRYLESLDVESTVDLDTEYSDFIRYSGDTLLLGYDRVDKISF